MTIVILQIGSRMAKGLNFGENRVARGGKSRGGMGRGRAMTGGRGGSEGKRGRIERGRVS